MLCQLQHMQGCGDFFLFHQIATLHKVVIRLVSFVIFFFQFLYFSFNFCICTTDMGYGSVGLSLVSCELMLMLLTQCLSSIRDSFLGLWGNPPSGSTCPTSVLHRITSPNIIFCYIWDIVVLFNSIQSSQFRVESLCLS